MPRLRPDSIVTAYAADETGSVTAAAAATAVATGQAPADQIATLVPDEFRAQGDIADDQDGIADAVMPPPPAPIAAVPADAADRFADMPVMSGWKIQLAAAPTQQAALAILQRARSEGAALFPDAAAYTEPVDEGVGDPLPRPFRRLRRQGRSPGRLRLPREEEIRLLRHRGVVPRRYELFGVRFL